MTYQAKEVKIEVHCNKKNCFSDKIFESNFGDSRTLAILIETDFGFDRPHEMIFQENQSSTFGNFDYQEIASLAFSSIGLALIWNERQRMKRLGYKKSVKFIKILKTLIIVKPNFW